MRYFIWQSSLGFLGAVAGEKGLLKLTLPAQDEALVYEELASNYDLEVLDEASFQGLVSDLNAYFKGEKLKELPPLDWSGVTPFQQKVLKTVATIPYGEVRSYKWVGDTVGCKAYRAVGQALGANPFPILIPCHRVITSSGKLGGFSGGLDKKIKLLALEGVAIGAK